MTPTEESIEKLLFSSSILFSKLRNSPFWVLVCDEPELKSFISALDEIEKQVKGEIK